MAIVVERKKDETDDDAKARAFINPNLRSACTISAFTSKGLELETGALVKQLKALCKDDNFNANEMLIAQAHTMDAIFNNLATLQPCTNRRIEFKQRECFCTNYEIGDTSPKSMR